MPGPPISPGRAYDACPHHQELSMRLVNDGVEAVRDDRRVFPRFDMSRPCKVFHPASGRVLAGRTRNLSAGGALVELDTPRDFVPGDRLELAIAWTRRAVLPADALVEAKVVRTIASLVLPDGTVRRTLGIAFAKAEPIARELVEAA